MYINYKYILPASLNALHAHFIVFVWVCVCVFTIYVILPQRRSFMRTHGFDLLQFACT